MRILITGATGFIGGALARKLVARGHDLRCLVRDEGRAVALLGDLPCEFAVGDTADPASLARAMEGVEAVAHLAALMGHDMPSEEAFARFRKANVEGTRNVVEAAKAAGVDFFLHVSSTAAMGLLDLPIVDEASPVDPFTPYQVSKWESEEVVREAARSGLPAVVVRPSMVYGPGFRGDFLTMAKIAKRGFFPKIGRGKNLSPALFIDDCAEGLALAMERGRTGETYLLSSAESYSLDRTAEALGAALGKRVVLVPVPRWIALVGAWKLERFAAILGRTSPVTARNIRSVTTDRVFDTSKAREELGFEQKVTLEDGLREAVAYFRAQGWI